MARNLLKSSVESAKFSIIFQVLFRFLTFVLNAFIIRHVGHDVLGIVNVRLLLLESTIMFLAKEPLIKACLTDSKSHNWAQIVNQIWLSVPFNLFLGLVFGYIWLYLLIPVDELYVEQYRIACYSVVISCVVDQSTQCVNLVAQSFCFVKLKVILETLFVILRTVTFMLLILYMPHNAILGFAFAQIFATIINACVYFGFITWYIYALKRHRSMKKCDSIFSDMQDFKFTSVVDFLPGQLPNKETYLNRSSCSLTLSFAKQSIIKQVLTEGERYVMTLTAVMDMTQQAIYNVVNNLGSLAARFLFRPIEDSAYFYFAQTSQRGKPPKPESSDVLGHTLHAVCSVGLVVLVFGWSYSGALLGVYGGAALSEPSLPTTLMRAHCFAVLLYALNGVAEAYVFAVMEQRQLNRYNYLMVIFSISFLLVSYVMTNIFGPVGLIYANCANMFARIAHSFYYICNKHKNVKQQNPLHQLKPGKLFLISLIVSSVSTCYSEAQVYPKSAVLHIVIGGIFFLLTLCTWCYENWNIAKLEFDKYAANKKKMSDVLI